MELQVTDWEFVYGAETFRQVSADLLLMIQE
jgi:hypothetical protein